MHPVKYDFNKIDQGLKDDLDRIHNGIYDKILKIKTSIKNGSSAQKTILLAFLEIYFSRFSKVNLNSKLDKTIFCLDSKLVQQLKNDHTQFQSLKNTKLELVGGKYTDSSKDSAKNIFDIILKTLNYDGNRQLFYRFLVTVEMNICSYCLNQYTVIYKSDRRTKSKWKMTAQLDHLHPKSEFPWLSISINNLFPVCAHCNNRKSKSIIDYNPLDDDYQYTWNFDACFKIQNGTVVFSSLDKLSIENHSKTIDPNKNLVEKLNYVGLYQNFDAYAKEFVERINNFDSRGYEKNTLAIFKNNNLKAEEKLKYFLSDQTAIEENIFKYPLTKFKFELYRSVKIKVSK